MLKHVVDNELFGGFRLAFSTARSCCSAADSEHVSKSSFNERQPLNRPKERAFSFDE
jgi:hypothetical protein